MSVSASFMAMGASSSKSSSSTPAATMAMDPGSCEDLVLLQSIYFNFHLLCRDCMAPIRVNDPREHIETWLAGAQRIPPASQLSGLSCRKCFQATCAGCGREPTLGPDNIFTSAGVVNACCSHGRLYSVWLLLSHFDEQEIIAKRLENRPRSAKVKKPKPSYPYMPPGAMAEANGIGYAGGWEAYYDPHHTPAASPLVNSEEECPDDITTLTLKILTASIPSQGSSDTILNELICLFRYSLLFDRLASLIRNDSIADLVERRDLYASVFSFLEAISEHRDLRHLLFERRLNLKNSPGLTVLATPTTRLAVFDAMREDRLPSIFAYGHNIFKQSSTFMKMIGKTPQGSAEHSKESVRMCNTVIKVYGKMRQEEVLDLTTTPDLGHSGLWAKYCEDNRVTFSDDVLAVHRFSTQFNGLKSSNTKGRLSAIGKEIANMTTSLPSGIFLKVAESRSDVMKALIVGIEGTPYAGGLFTFDIFLDGNYPSSPPKMAFVLNGNDSEEWSFNPNLHKNTGTVCLSIINTWQGSPAEMWQPGKSTILAVLISIQAMILGAPIPWINEPGYIGQAETQQAAEHRLLIQYKTVRYAMIGWLGDKRPENVIWDDVSATYWKYNGFSTMQTVKEWSLENSQLINGAKAKAKKQKKKAHVPSTSVELPVDNLVEKLSLLLDLGTTLDHEPIVPEESLTISSKTKGKSHTKSKDAKASTSKGKGKRKASELSDDDDDLGFDSYDEFELAVGIDFASPEPTAGGSSRKKRATTASKGKGKAKAKQVEEDEDSDPKWTYNGSKTQKETRHACSDFGIAGAKTIKDTIAKLEKYVNDNGLWEDEESQVWGILA